MKLEYQENPTEADFPLIDHCVVCEGICDWQPRYEVYARTPEQKDLLVEARPLLYVQETRTVKICADCVPNDNDELRRLIRREYPAFAKRKGI